MPPSLHATPLTSRRIPRLLLTFLRRDIDKKPIVDLDRKGFIFIHFSFHHE
jgi:hypothetical protein